MVKVALYGATGNAGSRILNKLAVRGHQITAIVRDPAKIPQPSPGVLVKQDDLSEPKQIAAAINGADAVISAYAPPQEDPDAIVGATQRLIDALGAGTSARLIVVGGARGLFVAPGVRLVDSGYLPEPLSPDLQSTRQSLQRAPRVDDRLDLPGAGSLFLTGGAHRLVPPGQKRTHCKCATGESRLDGGLRDCASGRTRSAETPPAALLRRLLILDPRHHSTIT